MDWDEGCERKLTKMRAFFFFLLANEGMKLPFTMMRKTVRSFWEWRNLKIILNIFGSTSFRLHFETQIRCLWYLKQCKHGVAAAATKSLQSCPTLCDPIDSSPPGSPVPGILQARTLEWVAISFSNA